MNMDLSVEAQATLSDLLLESRVLRVGTEEAHVIGFLLFAAWQRTVVGVFFITGLPLKCLMSVSLSVDYYDVFAV